MTDLTTQLHNATLGLPENKAKSLENAFKPMIEGLKGLEERYNFVMAYTEVTEEVTQEARILRLDIARLRNAADKVRKKEKEEFLLAGRAIDGVANIIKHQVMSKEKKLTEVENYFKIKHAEEVRELGATRMSEIDALCKKYDIKNIYPTPQIDELGLMDDTMWYRYCRGMEVDIKEAKIADDDARKKHEQEKAEQVARAAEQLVANQASASEEKIIATLEIEELPTHETVVKNVEVHIKEADRLPFRGTEEDRQKVRDYVGLLETAINSIPRPSVKQGIKLETTITDALYSLNLILSTVRERIADDENN